LLQCLELTWVFICSDLIIKNRNIHIKRYFKWWISIKLMWANYLTSPKKKYLIKINCWNENNLKIPPKYKYLTNTLGDLSREYVWYPWRCSVLFMTVALRSAACHNKSSLQPPHRCRFCFPDFQRFYKPNNDGPRMAIGVETHSDSVKMLPSLITIMLQFEWLI
jgi:hypothetical protein